MTVEDVSGGASVQCGTLGACAQGAQAALDESGDAAAQCRARADGYGLLARLFRVEVDEGLLKRLAALPATCAPGAPRAERGMAQMAAYAAGAGEGMLAELAVDYVRAFIGNGIDGHEAAYPFESAYTSEKHLLMQEARDEVLAIYLSEGVAKAPSWKVGEDHIAVELEFMQTLATRAAEAIERGDGAEARRLLTVQRAFLDAHLMRWVPGFAQDVRSFARTGFYRGLADATEGFLRADGEYLGAA